MLIAQARLEGLTLVTYDRRFEPYGGDVAWVQRSLRVVTTRDYFTTMKVVGVKALKARLSEYLRAVRRGDTILVADRDEVVAELRPALRARVPRGAIEEALEGLADTGEVTRAGLLKAGWTWRVAGLGLAEGSAARVLDALRAEG